MTDILSRIDDTLTFHSAGLGVDLEVPVAYRQKPSGVWECQGCVCHSPWTLAMRATG